MNDRRFLVLITVALIAVTLLPFVFGWWQRPAGTVYSGRHGLAPGDFANYYQMIEQARDGRVLFSDPFTSEPQNQSIFNPYWLGIGQLARLTSWSSAVIFQLARVLAIPLFVAALYWLISLLFVDSRLRKFILIFSIFASGIGALSMLWLPRFVDTNALLNQPIDLWVSEAVTFLTLLQTGHFIVATALIIVVFILIFRGLSQNRWRPIWWAGGAGLFLFFFHPFHLPTVFGVLGVYFIVQCIAVHRVRRDWLGKLAVFALVTMPAWLYQALLVWLDPIAAGRAAQNINLTPALWNTLLGYGFLIPAAVGGIWWLRKQQKLHGLYALLLVWLIVQAVLIYMPLDWQRRLTHGMQIPLAIFAAVGIYRLYAWLSRRYAKRYIFGALCAAGMLAFGVSNIYVYANDFSLLADPHYQQPAYGLYYPRSLTQAFAWVRQTVPFGDTVLAHYGTSNLLVAETARTVYVGHTVETLAAEAKREAVKRFYDPATSDSERLQFLNEHNVAYVMYGPIERSYAWHDPDFLPKAYINDEVTIYRAP